MTDTTQVDGVRGTSNSLGETEVDSVSGATAHPREHSDVDRQGLEARRKRRLCINWTLQGLAMVGLVTLLWPAGANWFASLHHDADVSGYTTSVSALTQSERLATLGLANNYNQHLPTGVLRDPYTSMGELEGSDAFQAYTGLLQVQGTDAIGTLTYPALGIGLPIFHGTSDEVLTKGVGHLFGSSLPVGGPGTHAALTSHSGQSGAKLFDNLLQAKVGQTFTVSALGQTSYYEVDQITTVTPDRVEQLEIVPGEDHVTLITCTPIGVNSHRLLVRGTRVAAPVSTGGSQAVAGDDKTAGFPWWAVGFIGGSATVAYLLFAPKRASKNPDPTARASVGGDGR